MLKSRRKGKRIYGFELANLKHESKRKTAILRETSIRD
jgi:hypothetical protein